MKIRDRIKELRRVPASELLPHPKNWRVHNDQQRNALRGVLAEIGFADAALAIETPDGLQLCDGHLRAEECGETPIPVLVLDLTAEEAAKLLVTHDPIGDMATADLEQLEGLLVDFTFDSPALSELANNLLDEATQKAILDLARAEVTKDATNVEQSEEGENYDPSADTQTPAESKPGAMKTLILTLTEEEEGDLIHAVATLNESFPEFNISQSIARIAREWHDN